MRDIEAKEVEEAEQHLIYVLLDSNLPTGGFVSSSGLESWSKHGFLSCYPSYSSASTSFDGGVGENEGKGKGKGRGKRNASEGIVEFTFTELLNYSKTTSCFVRDSWEQVWNYLNLDLDHNDEDVSLSGKEVEEIVWKLKETDKLHECSLLSHVGRRSSKAQGVAMLNLYVKGLSPTTTSHSQSQSQSQSRSNENETMEVEVEARQKRERQAMEIVNEYKRLIRKGDAPGHLAVCWGIMSACLGLKLDRAIHLHLFLHARSLLSSAVRLNLIGPYASTGLLLHPLKGIIHDTMKQLNIDTNTSYSEKKKGAKSKSTENSNSLDTRDPWEWADELEDGDYDGPETTWPLGELLMARHDLQHSRIFNS